MKELGRWGSPLVLYIIISGQLHCHSRPLEHPFWTASAPMYHSTSDIASVLQTAQLFFPPKFLLQIKRVNKMPRQQGQPLQEALYWFQNLVISATKENQRENKSHIHFIKPKKPKHDLSWKRHQFIQHCQKAHQRLKFRISLDTFCTLQVKITDVVKIRLWLFYFWVLFFWAFIFSVLVFQRQKVSS